MTSVAVFCGMFFSIFSRGTFAQSLRDGYGTGEVEIEVNTEVAFEVKTVGVVAFGVMMSERESKYLSIFSVKS